MAGDFFYLGQEMKIVLSVLFKNENVAVFDRTYVFLKQ
jgi:hypothetical protein